MARMTTLSMQVTYQCNIECRHCGPYCGPQDNTWMSVDEIKDLIRQAGELGVESIVFTGGEPTLLKKNLVDILHYAHDEVGIASSRMVTNARFATTRKRARDLLSQWQDAGLRELNVSCGEYHQEFVSTEYVANAYLEACDLGYATVLLVGEFLSNGKGASTPEMLETAVGKKLQRKTTMSPYSDFTHGLFVGEVMGYGRGKTEVPREGIRYRELNEVRSVCEDVNKVITVHPNGNVTACCGIMVRDESLLNIGNWREQSLESIVNNADRDIILNWIRSLGLRDMKKWLESKDPKLGLRDRYQNMCDLCAEIQFNPRCQELLLKFAHEREVDIVAAMVADDTAHAPDFYYGA